MQTRNRRQKRMYTPGLYIGLVVGFLMVLPGISFANNIVVENVSLVDQDTTNDTYDIQFDVAWDNSWFISGAPSATANWDAAWVFAKYSAYAGGSWSDWAHCTLLNTGSVAPTGSQMSFGATDSAYKGIFIYRSSADSGSVDWNDAEIRWAYGTDGVADGVFIKVKVFAIEMVLIPGYNAGQGWSGFNFYVGSGGSETSAFYKYPTTTNPYLISSEAAINVGATNDYLYYPSSTFGGDQSGPIPVAFPKGYNAFYIMKYEISQRQYCEFLNTLTATQQNNRHDSDLNFGSYRNFIKKTSASPAFFGCDANGNAGEDATDADKALLNESDDGEWVACNELSYMDVAAYADWAALRPFTELEFEKACRGGQDAVNDEYAWGNATLETATSSLTDAATTSEVPNQGNLNYNFCSPDGPYRCGSYADETSDRTDAGASYYGVMELSGNLRERPVTVGNSTGRGFTGTHGDGALTTETAGAGFEGNATNTDWPGSHPTRGVYQITGCGARGSSWLDSSSRSRVSCRVNAASVNPNRINDFGGRCARTSP